MALHLRSAGRQHAERLADLLRGAGAVLRKGRIRNRRLGRRLGRIRFTARAASRCPCRPCRVNREYGILKPAAQRLGLHPFDLPMLRNSVPYNGTAAVHAVPLVRGICLRGERQVRHAEYRHSRRPGHGQLRASHRLHGARGDDRRARPCHRRRVLRCRRPPARADRRSRDRLVGGRGIGAPAAELQEHGCIRRAWAIATTGWGAISRATPTRARGDSSISTPTTISGPARASRSATTTTATRD